ncbi:MAG: oligosaccharide flippase family protein [Clostridium sp.]|nr:oligosaccharide flippase family protein [Clostridium sp.]
MKQLIYYLIMGISRGLLSSIDNAFGNNTGIDGIVVLSSYTVINWIVAKFNGMGVYSYRATRTNIRTSRALSIFFSTLICGILLLLSEKIPLIFTLSDGQYKLFTECIKYLAVYVLFDGLFCLYYEYAKITTNNRVFTTVTIMDIIMMVVLDTAIYYTGGTVADLLAGTVFCKGITTIYLIIRIPLPKEASDFQKDVIQMHLKHGLNLMVDKLFIHIAIIVYSSFASKLGEYRYVIHSVCFSLICFTDHIPDAFFSYMLGALTGIEEKHRYQYCSDLYRKSLVFVGISYYMLSLLLLTKLRGELPYMECLPWTLIYLLIFIVDHYFAIWSIYLTYAGKSSVLAKTSILSTMISIAYILIGYYSGGGMVLFAFGRIVDKGIRCMFLYVESKKVHLSNIHQIRAISVHE